MATRNRLHGIKWPSINPKLLIVDFLSADEARQVSGGELIIEEQLAEAGGAVSQGEAAASAEAEGEKEGKIANEIIAKAERKSSEDSNNGESIQSVCLFVCLLVARLLL